MAIVIAGDCDRRALVTMEMQKATTIAMKWYYCVLAPSSALRADTTCGPRACYVAVRKFALCRTICSLHVYFDTFICIYSSTET
jgi:hypothetical protein